MIKFIFTCEHGGNQIPPSFKKHFEEGREVLTTHKGWDIGILPIAKKVAEAFKIPLFYSETSRLLIELNRSLDNPELFSSFTKNIPSEKKEEILQHYYFPYRNEIESKIKELVDSNAKVIHISFHSFTPVLNGQERNCDIGLLFDPQRDLEVEVCQKWKNAFEEADNKIRVKYNYPYQGVEDGFTTYLRTKFSKDDYAGIEVEFNQKDLLYQKNIDSIYSLTKISLETLFTHYQ